MNRRIRGPYVRWCERLSDRHLPIGSLLDCKPFLFIFNLLYQFYIISSNSVRKSFTLSCCPEYQSWLIKYFSISPPNINLYPYRANISSTIICTNNNLFKTYQITGISLTFKRCSINNGLTCICI